MSARNDKSRPGAAADCGAHDDGRRRFMVGTTAGLTGLALGGGLGGSAAFADPHAAPRRYQDKVVLITGATSGIGEATAHAYARAGAKVFFCGRRKALGEAVAEAIRAAGGEATYMQADVREQAQVRSFVERCVATYGGLDIAFNNAGIEGPRGALDEIDVAGDNGYLDVMRTNVDGVYYAMRYELPVLRGTGGGVIVNTGSMLSHRGSTFAGAYAASKHAVIGLTRSAAARDAANGIRVISISPGGVATDLLRRFVGGSLEGIGQRSPMGRIAQPAEVADVVLNLTAPEAVFLNGDDVKIDGASSAA
ncbi:MAG: SDR family NAD(P)-dependent oxidoreductase [Gammaproteobacteria bacterium]